MLNSNIQNIITFISFNLEDANMMNIDEFISDYQQVRSWAANVLNNFGSPDFLLNNAGILNKNADLDLEKRKVTLSIKLLEEIENSFDCLCSSCRISLTIFLQVFRWGISFSPQYQDQRLYL